MRWHASLFPVVLLVAGCSAPATHEAEPIHYDVGGIHRDVTTQDAEAQRWFDRGLGLAMGFNHAEARACFERAAEVDPDCAMAWWGQAYALSPNYNDPLPPPDRLEEAHALVQRARAELDQESAVERDLVLALSTRFAAPAPEDRRPLNEAYADAMRDLARRYADDAEVQALAAEAVMQLRPWGLWSPDGVAAPETPEIRSILEPALERRPSHPALCHLYIHTMEAGPEVERALPAARSLDAWAAQSGLGHLAHMPSHVYVWTGRYADVIRTNIDAVALDDAFVEARGRANFYTAYRVHNYHFVAYGAMWDGRRELALQYARAIPGEIPPELLAEVPDAFEVFIATPYHVLVRFGMWDELLAEPAPPETQPCVRAVWRYARGVALASTGRVVEAEAEQRAFREAVARVPESRMLFVNTVRDVLAVADKVLDGEIGYRKGEHDRAFALLREAVVLDERLNYAEPWGWMEPARHALGALLTEQGLHEEAVAVYVANLERYPENGWALHGLAESYGALGRVEDAADARARYEVAFARADTAIPGACFCKTR